MAAQQVAIHAAIIGVKRALSRPRDNQVAEEPISKPTNRGNKLKRTAEFVQQGRLDNPSGPATFKRRVVHAGYSRNVQYFNPPRYDVDGDLIEGWGDEDDNDDGDEADESLIEDDNIYRDIRLENLLAPLTTAAGLPSHPSLSVPYRSKALSEMVKHAEDFLHQQQRLLWKMKQILVTLRGDSSWVPVGAVHTRYNDWMLDASMTHGPEMAGWTHRTCLSTVAPEERQPLIVAITEEPATPEKQAQKGADVRFDDNLPTHVAPVSNGTSSVSRPAGHSSDELFDASTPATSFDRSLARMPQPTTTTGSTAETTTDPSTADPATKAATANSTGRRKKTAATAVTTSGNGHTAGKQHKNGLGTEVVRLSTSDPAAGPAATPSDQIHPVFEFDHTCIPAHDALLPPKEADDARAFLVSYVSKQEEIVRNAARLHERLLRAMLMGKTVWSWCRAEQHLGEMSDGEDWYDKDEWGLTEDLTKGEEEEEEVTSQKKPRRRGGGGDR